MPPKVNVAGDLIIALRDTQVLEAIGEILQHRLEPLLLTIAELKGENAAKTTRIAKLQSDLDSVTSRLLDLEASARRDNLVVTGLPIESYSEAASTTSSAESVPNRSVEQTVLKLFNQQMGVVVQSEDISIAYRIKKKGASANLSPPITIVRFTNRTIRETIYAARSQLKNNKDKIFINEDLNKTTSDIFYKARKLVKEKVIHSTWTSACEVYIKERGDPDCRPKKIRVYSDLPKSPNLLEH